MFWRVSNYSLSPKKEKNEEFNPGCSCGSDCGVIFRYYITCKNFNISEGMGIAMKFDFRVPNQPKNGKIIDLFFEKFNLP